MFGIWRVLSPAVVGTIDETIAREVMPFVRRFDSLPRSLAQEANELADTSTPATFAAGLQRSWKDHNAVALDIDAFLCAVALVPDPWTDTRLLSCADRLVRLAFSVEHSKRIHSAGVKRALDRFVSSAEARYNLSQPDLALLLTPSVPNFWTFYHGEHALYFLAKRCGSDQIERRRCFLRDTFHAAADVVCDRRLERDFGFLEECSLRRLRAACRDYGATLERLNQGKSSLLYLLLERRDLGCIHRVVRYDNYDEPLFGRNLWGVPDLLLRRTLIDHCVRVGILDARPSVLYYSETDLVQGIATMRVAKETQ